MGGSSDSSGEDWLSMPLSLAAIIETLGDVQQVLAAL